MIGLLGLVPKGNLCCRVFPITINSTTIFNMPVLTSLINMLQQESLSEDAVAECQKVIYNLISMENKGETLPSPLTR